MKRLLSVMLIVGALFFAGLFLLKRESTDVPFGPMVQAVTTEGFALVWKLAEPVKQVRLFDRSGALVQTQSSQPDPFGRQWVRFESLGIGETYTYKIYSETRSPVEATVQTAPKPGTNFRVLAFGDSGSGDRNQYALVRRMIEQKPDLIVHTGDLIYQEGETEDYPERFYQPYAALIDHIPFYPCVGNHDFDTDQGRPMFEQFVLPENGPASQTPERHYWFDYGDARFAAIDSNLSYEVLAGQVAPWLDQLLAEADERWKVVFFHHPAHTHGHYDPTQRIQQALVPILEARRVNLVLNGHNHVYQRFHPLRGGTITTAGDGVHYVVTGAGGAELYELDEQPVQEIAVQYNAKHNFTVLDFSPEYIRLRQISIDGELLDNYSIPHFTSVKNPEKQNGDVES